MFNTAQRRTLGTGTLRWMAAWRTVLGDTIGLMFVVWSIPVAILLVGAPIVLLAALLIEVIARIAQ